MNCEGLKFRYEMRAPYIGDTLFARYTTINSMAQAQHHTHKDKTASYQKEAKGVVAGWNFK